MNNRILRIVLFACLSLFIIGVPVSMIIQQQEVLNRGREFRFKTVPIDPFDAFRGRYVALSLEERSAFRPLGMRLKFGQRVFALIETPPGGFARISKISLTKPKEGNFLKARVRYVVGHDVILDLPIDRYYMEESKAPKAEELYRRHSSGQKSDAFVVVRIKNGNAVVKNLYVGGLPITEVLRARNK